MTYPVEFIEARIAEDRRWAQACSKPYEHADAGQSAPPDGVHWAWGVGGNWEITEPDLGRDIIGAYGQNVQLRTVEQWHAGPPPLMARPYSDHMCEVDSAAAGHIIRHDPHRVLRECQIREGILDRHRDCIGGYGYCGDGGFAGPGACPDLEDLAATWAGHPDYQEPAE